MVNGNNRTVVLFFYRKQSRLKKIEPTNGAELEQN
jgi:hypothetical protein